MTTVPDRECRDDIDVRAIGRRLLRRREQQGLKQQDVARRAERSEAYVNRLENGLVANPRVNDLVAVARALAVPLDALLHGCEPSPTEQEALAILARHPGLSRILANIILGLQLASLEDREYLVGHLELMDRRYGAIPPAEPARDRLERRLALLRLFGSLAPGAGVEQLLTRAAEEASIIVPCDLALSYRWDEGQGALALAGSTVPVPAELRRLAPGQAIAGRAFEARKTVAVGEYQREIPIPIIASLGLHAAAATPILLGDRPIGVLSVARFHSTDPFTPEDLATLERLAKITAETLGAR
ncbi:MAG: helix-turn-helix domain-containing protein [Chloroflexi bacterium]|nr:helix-turn-helix domain-containing protein [Chloroflexota bacterium]